MSSGLPPNPLACSSPRRRARAGSRGFRGKGWFQLCCLYALTDPHHLPSCLPRIARLEGRAAVGVTTCPWEGACVASGYRGSRRRDQRGPGDRRERRGTEAGAQGDVR